MKRFVYGCLVVLIAVVVAQADELVKNGSFETPYAWQPLNTLPCVPTIGSDNGNWWCIAPSGFAGMEWTVEWADAIGSVGNLEFWRVPNPQGVTAPDGSQQLVEIDTHARPDSANANVRIFQSIATCPGANYNLSYYWRPRPGISSSSQSVSVLWAGVQLASHTGASLGWQAALTSVTGKFGLQKLEFVAGGNGDQNGMLLDAVSLTGPNPATLNACTSINIKPNSDPNSINICSSGTVPVTIWGSATFDVSTVDPASLMLAGAGVNTVGKTARYQCSISDSGRPDIGSFDGIGLPDGYPDLTCHFETAANMFDPAATSATVSMTVCQNGFSAEGCAGKLSTPITATDAVRIVKDGCE